MAIYDFFLSRNNGPTGATYVGHTGRLFYDSTDGLFRLSDGVTPGGTIVANLALAKVSETEPVNPQPGEMWLNPTTYELWAYHNGAFIPTIDTATETKIGGIKLGPGVTTNAQGQIIIDSSGLDFSFGDFGSSIGEYTDETPYALLQTVNLNEDAVIASNGTGRIAIVGEFAIHATDGSVTGSLETPPVFSVSSEGDISATSLDIQETNDLGLMAALNVTINEQGLTKTPTVVTGSVAQFTGRDNRTAILVVDTYGNDVNNTLTGGQLTFRTGRGTNETTTAVQSGDRLGEVTAAGWASNGYGGLAVGGLRILANENYTATARGSKLELFVTPNGTLTPGVIATLDSIGLTMATGKVITQSFRNAGSVGGTTVTLNWSTDSMVRCTFTDNFTVAFSNYAAGRTITLIATNTSAGDSDIITAGISAVNIQGDNTVTVTEQTTAIITYYCTGTTVNDVFASAVYA